jgi:prepilin-type N-terminal cleavage/methylation domain-containing protein
MKTKKEKTGFTLLEVSIVVGLLSLLATITVPTFTNARAKSLTSACQNNLRLIDGAVQQYGLDNDNLPPSALIQLVGTNGFIKDIPRCGGGGDYRLPATLSAKTVCTLHGSL